QGQQALQSILGSVTTIYESVLYMSNLFDYLAFSAPPAAAPPPVPVPSPDEKGIRFDDVGFRYPVATSATNGSNGAGSSPHEEKWALRHVSFFVPRGQSIALVGENGAGKTTVVKLLTRLYEPTEGRVVLDGKDLRAWD